MSAGRPPGSAGAATRARAGHSFAGVRELLAETAPEEPVFCVYLPVLAARVRRLLAAWRGPVRYDVATNPLPAVLRLLSDEGLRHFAVSDDRQLPLLATFGGGLEVLFRHPVKSRPAIRCAVHDHGVRCFAVDHPDELTKVIAESAGAALTVQVLVLVRLPDDLRPAGAGGCAGAGPGSAVELLRAVCAAGLRPALGIYPGLGGPAHARRCLRLCRDIVSRAGLPSLPLDLGSADLGSGAGSGWAADLAGLWQALAEEAALLGLDPADLVLSPGADLVRSACSVVVQVLLRKTDRLHVNDGRCGWLYPLVRESWRGPLPVPVRLHRPDGSLSAAPLRSFAVFGPTCDSYDRLGLPFLLPSDVREGDWIEVGWTGADTVPSASRFNGFYPHVHASIDSPHYLGPHSGADLPDPLPTARSAG